MDRSDRFLVPGTLGLMFVVGAEQRQLFFFCSWWSTFSVELELSKGGGMSENGYELRFPWWWVAFVGASARRRRGDRDNFGEFLFLCLFFLF